MPGCSILGQHTIVHHSDYAMLDREENETNDISNPHYIEIRNTTDHGHPLHEESIDEKS